MKLIIFDVDGTLVDSQAHIVAAMEFAFARVGIELPVRDALLSIVGLSLPEAMSKLCPQASPSEIDALVDGYRASYAELRIQMKDAAPFYPYAEDVLEDLSNRDDVLLGMATGKSRRGVRHIIEAHQLDRVFVTTQTADTHPSKPHPSMLMDAMAEAGVEAADTVMIGDTTYDMEMAGNAGIAGIGVAWGYHSVSALEGVGATQTVLKDFRELIPYLCKTGFLR